MSVHGLPLALFGQLGMGEILIVAIVGILLFGRRLPEVGKNLGKTIVEFKKGLNATTDEINRASSGNNNTQEVDQAPANPEPKRLPAKRPVKHIATSDEP